MPFTAVFMRHLPDQQAKTTFRCIEDMDNVTSGMAGLPLLLIWHGHAGMHPVLFEAARECNIRAPKLDRPLPA